jgi:hypothetical protein
VSIGELNIFRRDFVEKFLMPISNSLVVNQVIADIKQTNEDTLQFGLKLSEKDIRAVIAHRTEALKSTGRIEFSGEIIKKIICSFCDSPYILQENYVEIINDLVETFYFYKNETLEEISDDELIDFMKEYFDNKCQGDLDLLRDKYLERVAHNVKFGILDYFDVDQDMDLDYYDDDEYGDGGER